MKKIFKYPISYLITIVILYSVYDYFDHVLRPGSTFEAHPWYWLLFSVSAVLSFVLVVLLIKNLLQRSFNLKNLLIEVVAIGIWLVLYISILGPFLDKLFWPYGDLSFKLKFGPVFIILIAYFIIRLIINLIAGKSALYSE